MKRNTEKYVGIYKGKIVASSEHIDSIKEELWCYKEDEHRPLFQIAQIKMIEDDYDPLLDFG